MSHNSGQLRVMRSRFPWWAVGGGLVLGGLFPFGGGGFGRLDRRVVCDGRWALGNAAVGRWILLVWGFGR